MHLSRSLRALSAHRSLAIIAVATLTLGLGVNASIFSLTREVLLRPLPFRDADRLVRISESSTSLGRRGASVVPVNYVAWRDHADAFDFIAAFRRASFNVAFAATAVQVEGFQVEPSFFPMLDVEPARGRGFTPEDGQPGRDTVVLLTDGFWRRRFGADPSVVGRSIAVDGTSCVVIGVLPSTFSMFRVLNREVDIYRPLVIDAGDREQSLNVYAKLRSERSLEAARDQMRALYYGLPIPDHVWSADVVRQSAAFAASARSILLTLEWAAALVLLIACANVANLFLAVSARRRRELAIRQAIGARRWDIIRDFAGEAFIVTTAGGVLAIGVAMLIVDVLNATVSFQDINRFHAFRIDGMVIGFTMALMLATAMVFSLLPAHSGDADIVSALKDSTESVTPGVSNRRLRQGLVIGQVALSIVLAVVALSLTRSALALHAFGRGFVPDGVMTAQVSLNGPRYEEPSQLVQMMSRTIDHLTTSAGVKDATLVNYPPVGLIGVGVPVSIEGQSLPADGHLPIGRYFVTSPRYFEVLRIPILAGRDFTAADDWSHAGVAIVSERFAQRFWNTTDVIGRHLTADFPQSRAFWIPRARRGTLTVVGVVGNIHEDGMDAPKDPEMYLPYAQNPTVVVTVLARAVDGPLAAASIREAVRAADSQAPVSFEKSFDAMMDETFARPREMAWLVGAFAGLALALSAIGVYGLMSLLTVARAHEIGLRMALGATPADIVTLVVRHSLKLALIGAVIGAGLAPLALRLVGTLLFGVSSFDPITILTVAALLLGVSFAAAAIPALRSARQSSVSFR